jgi:hypothetical protein
VTLPFIDERYFLTVTQLVLPLHEVAADPATEPLHTIVDPVAVKSIVEPLRAALTKTSCLCVRV